MSHMSYEQQIEHGRQLANEFFRKKEYQRAIGTYSAILMVKEYVENVEKQTLRVIRSNRATAHLKQGNVHAAISDCRFLVSDFDKQSQVEKLSDPELIVFRKVLYRLSQALQQQEERVEARAVLLRLRNLIPNMSDAEFYRAYDPHQLTIPLIIPATSPENATTIPTRSMHYDVHVHTKDDGVVEFRILEKVPLALVVTPDPEPAQALKFIDDLTAKHDKEIMNKQDWGCFNCDLPSTRKLHVPIAFWEAPTPRVVDMVYPVCATGSQCDKEATKTLAEFSKEFDDGRADA